MCLILVLFVLRLLWYRNEAVPTSAKTIIMQRFPNLVASSFLKTIGIPYYPLEVSFLLFQDFVGSILDENCTPICQICHGNPSLKGEEAHLAGFLPNKIYHRCI